ncbi:hypothetical protein [Streptococcus sp. HSISS2]|uniref:hypothetical protein n=1 Tax=Streptococcus sp. HSISS2 TaxID=1316411 RepID=UPI001969D86D
MKISATTSKSSLKQQQFSMSSAMLFQCGLKSMGRVFWTEEDCGIHIVAFIKYEDNKEATLEKKQWLKGFFDEHLDKETKLFIDDPFDKWDTKGDVVYLDTLRNCLFQQRCKAYTEKQIASIYKEWLLNH